MVSMSWEDQIKLQPRPNQRNDVSPNLDTGAHPSFAHTPENKEVRDRVAEAIAAFHETVLFHPLFFTLDSEQPGRMVGSFHPISP